MTRPYKIEGSQKQFTADPTDKVVQSWLYIESKLQTGFRLISARNLSAKLSELEEIFNNYRAIGWEVEVGKNFVTFEAFQLLQFKNQFQIIQSKIINTRELKENGSLVFQFEGTLLTLVRDKFPCTNPEIAVFSQIDGTKGQLKIIHHSQSIEPWYKFVMPLYFSVDTYLVYQL